MWEGYVVALLTGGIRSYSIPIFVIVLRMRLSNHLDVDLLPPTASLTCKISISTKQDAMLRECSLNPGTDKGKHSSLYVQSQVTE